MNHLLLTTVLRTLEPERVVLEVKLFDVKHEDAINVETKLNKVLGTEARFGMNDRKDVKWLTWKTPDFEVTMFLNEETTI